MLNGIANFFDSEMPFCNKKNALQRKIVGRL